MPAKKRSSAKPVKPAPIPAPEPLVRTDSPYVVDTIFPCRRLHIIGGPAHAGKTSLMFRIMADWNAGLNVFGFRSHRMPFCYVSCVDNLEACQDVVRRMCVSGIPVLSATDHGGVNSIETLYNFAVKAHPDVRVIFLDSILRVAEGNGLDNKMVGDVLDKWSRFMQDRNLTIIATGRCAKPKDNKASVRSIDRFLGATCWTEFASTFIGIEPRSPNRPRDDRRKVAIMPKGSASFELYYRFTSEGHFVEVSDDNMADSPDRIEQLVEIIDAHNPGDELTTAELIEYGHMLGIIARSTMMSYLQLLTKSGKLQDAGYGKYKIPAVQ